MKEIQPVRDFPRLAESYVRLQRLTVSVKALLDFLETYPHQHAVDISGYIADVEANLPPTL